MLTGESMEDLPEASEVVHTPTTDSRTMRWDSAKQVLARLFASVEELPGVRTFADVLSPEVMTLAHRMGLDSEVGEIGIDHLAGSALRWDSAKQVLARLFASAEELLDVRTFADVLSPEVMTLAHRTGLDSEVSEIGIDHLTGSASGLLSSMVIRVGDAIDLLTETERTIIDSRLISNPPETLRQLGMQFGVTKEQIRHIQKKTERKVQPALGVDLAIVASVLKERFGQVIEESELERRMDELLPVDQGRATNFLRRALLHEMGFKLDAGVFLDKQAKEELESIRGGVRKLADDVGLIDKHRFIESLPFERWRQRWSWVRKHCELVELFGSLGIRDTGKARVKAALISLGRPATRGEIARMCSYRNTRAGSRLSVVPSIVRADKDRWALKEWVDEEYRGIAEKIIQRIEENGGATTTEKLLTELPDKFGVHKSSVRAYMETPKFVINDGWISLANKSSVQLRDLDDVIDGRDHTGAPYWSFPVDARYFEGYSVPSVPPELAKELGCEPDGNKRVSLENLPDCRDLSINWRLKSTTGASLGYVREPLRRLGLGPGRRARLTIKGYCLAQLTADDESQEPAD